MNSLVAEVLSLLLLLAVLASAVLRPFGWPEAVVAVPAAAVVLLTGAVSVEHGSAEVARLAPVIGFLAVVLVLARICDDEGLFRACGLRMARTARGRPRRLLVQVFIAASVTTAILSLDATVVLLTPVVFATATRLGVRPKPHVYACGHLSNTASLLFPVSNLTNLLAFSATGLTFARFAMLMALPWLIAIAAEYLVFRRFFGTDLDAGADGPRDDGPRERPWFALATLAATLVGFVATSAAGVNPVWAALAGAVILGIHALLRRRTSARAMLRSADLPFLVFVLALGVVVRGVVDNGLAATLGRLIPSGASLSALLGIAALAAVIANLINNLPGALVLLPLVAPAGPGAVLAALVGVNIGPNLTYAGSLATLLWRRVVQRHDNTVPLGEFTWLGLLTVPTALSLAVGGLWLALIGWG